MFERLTDPAREVLVHARLAAQGCRHASIEAPHLLAGILRIPETKGYEALDLAGLRYLRAARRTDRRGWRRTSAPAAEQRALTRISASAVDPRLPTTAPRRGSTRCNAPT